jgi:hypothetical protein
LKLVLPGPVPGTGDGRERSEWLWT